MTQWEKLKKIFKKASKFPLPSWMSFILNDWLDYSDLKRSYIYMPIIFSHDFAKSYWGEEELAEGKTLDEFYEEYKDCYINKEEIEADWGIEIKTIEAWRYYILLLASTPENKRIDYLYKFVEKK